MSSDKTETVWTAEQAVRKAAAPTGTCEFKYVNRKGDKCTRKAPYWVQRGPINRRSCPGHLAPTVKEFWQIAPGRYGVTEHSDGYWISHVHVVVVKMQVTEGGIWR